MERHLAFETTHPAVPGVCMAGIVALGMAVFHPVYLALTLAGALLSGFLIFGARFMGRKLCWLLPMLALVCVANPLFSASGSTELARIGMVVVYAESLAYGACMGVMLVGSVLWLEVAARLVAPERVMATAGRALPTVSLMISLAAGLVPQLLGKARRTSTAIDACTCAGTRYDARAKLAQRSSMLVSWAMEDSLERADAMRARGWGADVVRTSYRRYEMTERDMVAIAAIALLVAASAALGYVAASQWRFYPIMPRLVMWWGYLPYASLVFVPGVATLAERVSWSQAARRPAGEGSG